MNYTLLLYQTPEDFAARNDPERREAHAAPWPPFLQAVQDAGIFVAGAGLEASHTATTLRFDGEERIVQDGPFADTKEQLGGFLLIDVPDLDTALDWAARFPKWPGRVVEVRPNLDEVRPNLNVAPR